MLAFIGMIMQWCGVYNLLDNEIFPHTNFTDPVSVKKRLHVDWGYFLVGMLILVLTNTFYNMATVFPPEVDTSRTMAAVPRLSLASRIRHIFAIPLVANTFSVQSVEHNK